MLACADRTSSTIRAYWLSPAGARTRAFRTPSRLRLPLKKREPGRAGTGIGSPVSREVSTLELPSTTSTSQGISSPGRTRIRSPTFTASTATSLGSPRSSWCAILGAAASSSRTAAEARPSAYRSSASPPVCMSTTTSPASGWTRRSEPTMAKEATRSAAKRPAAAPRTVLQTTGMPVMASPTVQSSRAGRGPTVYRRARPPTMQSRAPAGSAAAPRPISCCWRWLPSGRPGAG